MPVSGLLQVGLRSHKPYTEKICQALTSTATDKGLTSILAAVLVYSHTYTHSHRHMHMLMHMRTNAAAYAPCHPTSWEGGHTASNEHAGHKPLQALVVVLAERISNCTHSIIDLSSTIWQVSIDAIQVLQLWVCI